MASLFHCGQADGYSEAVASLRRAQDIRRVPKAAVAKSLDHVRYSGMDRDRRCRAFKVCVVGCVLGRQSGGCGVAGRREGSRDAWATGCWQCGPEVTQPSRKEVRSARNARHAGGAELVRWGRREWLLKYGAILTGVEREDTGGQIAVHGDAIFEGDRSPPKGSERRLGSAGRSRRRGRDQRADGRGAVGSVLVAVVGRAVGALKEAPRGRRGQCVADRVATRGVVREA